MHIQCMCTHISYSNTVLYRDYAHPYCMLQSSYRWDGLNFENSSFASKLRPLMKKLRLFCLRLRLPALEILINIQQ